MTPVLVILLDDRSDVDQLVELLGSLLRRSVLGERRPMVIRACHLHSGGTANDSMLKPRQENSAATRASAGLVFDQHRQRASSGSSGVAFGCVVERGECRGRPGSHCWCRGHHQPRVSADDEVTSPPGVVDRPRLVIDVDDVLFPLAPQPTHPQGLDQSLQSGMRCEMNGRKSVCGSTARRVEQALPLPHHAQVAVVDQRTLTGMPSTAQVAMLVGHLEAAVAVDRPDLGAGEGDLGMAPWQTPWCPDCRSSASCAAFRI